MTFLQPTFLTLLALAAIPVVLYLLFRRRRQDVEWGAMYILRKTLASQRRQSLWKQIAIISLRTLMLAVIVLAFARPLRPWRPSAAGLSFPHPPGTVHRVVMLDNSQSMDARKGPGSRLDAARDVAAALLSSLRAGDSAHVIALAPASGSAPARTPLTGQADEALPVADSATAAAQPALTVFQVSPPTSAGRIRERIDSIEIAPAPIDMATALRLALDAFRASAASSRELVILTDLCRIDHPAIADYRAFGESFSRLGVRVVILDLGADAQPNLAVETLSAGIETWLAGQPPRLYCDVMNYGDEASADGHLQLLVDGQLTSEEPCVLPAGHRRTLAFNLTLPGPSHRLEVRLRDDVFGLDNTLERFVQARSGLAVLLVTGDEQAQEGFQKESAFLERALVSTSKGPSAVHIRKLQAGLVTPPDFEAVDVVVIAGAARLPGGLEEAVDAFVRRGGGLLLTCGPAVEAAAFNAAWARWLPARLREPFRGSFDEERYLSIQTTDLASGVLREFESSDNGDLASARVYNHFRLDESDRAGALLSLSNGDPLLLERRWGRGVVLLFTSSLGGAWTSLPVRQAYVPLLVRLFCYAADGHGYPLNLEPGTPLVAEVKGPGPFYMTTPDTRLSECAVAESGGRTFVRFDATEAPGVYELRDPAGASLARFSIARARHESDLRSLDAKGRREIEEALAAQVAMNAQELATALRPAGAGVEVTTWFLLAVLAMLALDATLTKVWFA